MGPSYFDLPSSAGMTALRLSRNPNHCDGAATCSTPSPYSPSLLLFDTGTRKPWLASVSVCTQLPVPGASRLHDDGHAQQPTFRVTSLKSGLIRPPLDSPQTRRVARGLKSQSTEARAGPPISLILVVAPAHCGVRKSRCRDRKSVV